MLALITLAVFGVVGALLHWSLQRELLLDENEALEANVDVVQRFADEMHSPSDLAVLKQRLDVARIGNREWRVWIIGADGRLLYGGTAVPETRSRADGHITIICENGATLTGLRSQLHTGVGLHAQVLIGIDPRARQDLMHTYDREAALVCALGVATTISLCIWVTRRGLAPLRKLSDEAAAIEPGALSRRLSNHHDSRELAPLVESFNHALDRVEEAYRQLEGFGADVAHELRTPLAVLISGTEVALSRDRSVEYLQDELESHLEELRGLASMVNDMLFLARADRGEHPEHLLDVSLRDEALGVAEYLEASIIDGHHRLRVEGDVLARANPSLVRRALVNLVTNAARHTPEGETIVVRIGRSNGSARVSVCNRGPQISEEVRARMFDRFWRGEASRTKSTERYGLGLAIVRAVARMHDGEAFAGSHAGVTTVGFTIGSVI